MYWTPTHVSAWHVDILIMNERVSCFMGHARGPYSLSFCVQCARLELTCPRRRPRRCLKTACACSSTVTPRWGILSLHTHIHKVQFFCRYTAEVSEKVREVARARTLTHTHTHTHTHPHVYHIFTHMCTTLYITHAHAHIPHTQR